MKLVCAPKLHPFTGVEDELDVILYDHTDTLARGSVGASVKDRILREKLQPATKAWDFLSLALSVTVADMAGHRNASPDGWTRQLELVVAVVDPNFWNTQSRLIEKMLGFLTTDTWRVHFIGGGEAPALSYTPVWLSEDCVLLLSGGLDSFTGAIDLVANGKHPLAVRQIVRGDAENQRSLSQAIGSLRHLQFNHNAQAPNPENPPSQRARSLIFIAFGVLAATTLQRYQAGNDVTLYMCENGFISINPPLTGARLGSLSTRTTHPIFLNLIRQLLDTAGLRVHVENPYQLKTKGEMLRECVTQVVLQAHAVKTTSCGRYKRFGYTHCGRCVPCLVRRAAFLVWGITDTTKYVYEDLGYDDAAHAAFDDVRAVAMALAEVQSDGLESWIGTALSSALIGDIGQLRMMVGRGLEELGSLFKVYGVK